MNIDFNNVRQMALSNYDDLTSKLNSSVIKSDELSAELPGGGYQNLKGFVVIDAARIQNNLDDLRMMIGAIASTYEPGDEKFRDMYSETYGADDRMVCFNSDGEDNG